MVRPNLSDPKSWINSCLITRYDDGVSSIPLHSDDETFVDPESEILTVSIGATRTVKFIDKEENTTKSLEVVYGSAYVMSRFSQDFWKHGFDKKQVKLMPE